MLQLSILPQNIFRWIAGILALAILLVAAWFLLAKPTLESVANQAAQTAAGQQQAAISKAQKDADDANQRLDRTNGAPPRGATPGTPTPSTSAAKTPITTVQRGRISAVANNGQRSNIASDASILVPDKGESIVLSRITFQNYQKDAGSIELLMDNQVIWGPQALENIFELNYDFDPVLTLQNPRSTPTPAPPRALKIRITCTKAGDPLPVNGVKQGGGTCRDSVVFAYTLITPRS
jgi:hypothetical protein